MGQACRPAAALVALAAASGAVLAADLPEHEARGVLRVLVVLDVDGRDVARQRADSPGFDFEILEAFGRLRRLRLEIVPVTGWDRLVPALLEEDGDLIAGSFTDTAARRERIDFTDEVMPTRSVVVTRRPHRMVRTLEELRAERVTVFRGTSMADLVRSLGVPDSRIDHDVPPEGLAGGLRSGKLSCVVQDVQSAFADRRADPELQIGTFVGPPASNAFGVRKDAPRLRAALDEHLANVRRSGMWSRLVVKYYGEAALAILQKARGE